MWKDHAEKVCAFTEEFAAKNPKTVKAILKALHLASEHLDNLENRAKAAEIVARAAYINTTPESNKFRSTPIGNLTLYAYDAETGKRLYSSGKTISNWVHFSEPVIALGKVFLVTNDSQVIAFGLGAPRR